MSEQEFQALQQWDNNDLLDGVKRLLTVSEVNSLTDLFRLNELAESYRRTYPLTDKVKA
ncbi:hypothetical protein [Oceanospirillum maris]|jgi:hypothetical protein|uniref:hypothetical protein n=1 Tax=Oceanospirillum maris TaxID=64977 RepID=UPI0004199404|nr:hypothetical protein [Oceanospirillum maris]